VAKFIFRGKPYDYFLGEPNRTWTNERAVEVPVVWEVVRQYHPADVLEFGGVLSHYYECSHDVLDKRKKENPTFRVDIVDWEPPRQYLCVVSISTLEHVGHESGKYKEKPAPFKFLAALGVLISAVAPGGQLLITVPVGYHRELDAYLESGDHGLDIACMRKVSPTRWVECEPDFSIQYGSPYRRGNGVLFLSKGVSNG
jgi:hypothetical protein